jgi:phenylacetate-coenzyme A ligase PaaK-like adenylate-forming protein
MVELENKIRSLVDADQFEKIALEVFQFQYKHVKVYRDYVNQIGKQNPTSIEEIPFLPISFFKTHDVIAEDHSIQATFKSSGTGGKRSQHLVHNLDLYKETFSRIYQQQIGNTRDQVILALLPNYVEQGESSLVYMVNTLIEQTSDPLSGFLLEEPAQVLARYKKAIASGKQVVLFGVSYALLDLCEQDVDISKAIIIETGGMKGRRKEMTKEELHSVLQKGLKCPSIYSEYGMTELLSQGYSTAKAVFTPGDTMNILIREVNDPFTYAPKGKTGGINVVDLANLYSCSFIETQDLGKEVESGFQILGRFDNSDLRGCNLLVS